jgi:hypothetical protein
MNVKRKRAVFRLGISLTVAWSMETSFLKGYLRDRAASRSPSF